MNDYPPILYKYRDLGWPNGKQFLQNNNTKSLIYDQQLYFASPAEFNDPFDVGIPFRFDASRISVEELEAYFSSRIKGYTQKNRIEFREELAGILASPSLFDELFHDHNLVKELIRKDFRICCLADSPLNYLMWSHYSNSHTGICVGLDNEILCKELNRVFGIEHNYMFKVDYEDDLPLNGLTLTELFQTGESLKAVTTKGKIWEYESEYRIILGVGQHRETLRLPKECFKEFYFGWYSHPIKTRIISRLKQLYPSAKYYQIKPDGQQFKLDKDEITTQ